MLFCSLLATFFDFFDFSGLQPAYACYIQSVSMGTPAMPAKLVLRELSWRRNTNRFQGLERRRNTNRFQEYYKIIWPCFVRKQSSRELHIVFTSWQYQTPLTTHINRGRTRRFYIILVSNQTLHRKRDPDTSET